MPDAGPLGGRHSRRAEATPLSSLRSRRTALVGALARASALVQTLSSDLTQCQAQVGALTPSAATLLWTPLTATSMAVPAVKELAGGCSERHGSELAAQAQQAAAAGTPLLRRLPCPAGGEHEVFAVPLVAGPFAGPPATGALVLLSLPGQPYADGDLLLAALATARLGELLQRDPPGATLARQADLRGRLLTEVIAAAESERKRIAADIHDDTLQTMGLQLVRLQIVRRLLERGAVADAQRELDTLSRSIEENADRLRVLMGELRPSTLRDYGLLATIDDLIQRFREQTGAEITFASRLGRRLPDEHETMVYRIVQEALNNIRKHAHATRASIQLEGMGDWYTLTIEDDGQGFVPDEAIERSLRSGHFGLITMRERADLVGGSFAIDSAPGAGTRLRFHLPRLS